MTKAIEYIDYSIRLGTLSIRSCATTTDYLIIWEFLESLRFVPTNIKLPGAVTYCNEGISSWSKLRLY